MNSSKQELLERNKLVRIIRDWAGENKKVFWKYEVSCFYKTYILNISNLPAPSEEDITVLSNKRLLSDQHKKKLCNAIRKECGESKFLTGSAIDVKIDYVNESVVTEAVLQPGTNQMV